MSREHTALIHWSDHQVELGLPAISQTIDPAWFEDDQEKREGWSLLCRFPVSPREGGNPTPARVRFFMENAPHDRLQSGVSLRLFERATREMARVSIVD